MAAPRQLGLIAGSKSLPLVFAEQARAMGITKLVAIAFHDETDPAIQNLVDELTWIRVGQLSKLIAAFKGAGITDCVMLGQIAPRNLFDIRPDLRAMRILLRVREKNAHSLFGAIIQELATEGVRVIEPLPWLQPLIASDTFHLGRKLTTEQKEDVAFGFQVAKQITAIEIGQTVVVKNGAVLAVEAFEGTDQCLARGGALAGPKGGAIAVKVARHNHDMRFDIPCIGAQTIRTCLDAGVAVLAVEAGKTLVLERTEIERRLANAKFSVVGTR